MYIVWYVILPHAHNAQAELRYRFCPFILSLSSVIIFLKNLSNGRFKGCNNRKAGGSLACIFQFGRCGLGMRLGLPCHW